MPRHPYDGYQTTGTHTDNTSLANKITQVVQKIKRSGKTVSLKNGGDWIQKNPQGHPVVAFIHPFFTTLNAKDTNKHAYLEMLAGEWLRLQNPIQPKVRIRNIAAPGKKPEIKVLSKRLKDFTPFGQLLVQMGRWSAIGDALQNWGDALSGRIPGFGKGLFSAITTLNGDLHEGNIGFATNERQEREIVVIDTGQAYMPLLTTWLKGTDIKAADIENFPFIEENKFITENIISFFASITNRQKISQRTLWDSGVTGQIVSDRKQQISPGFIAEKHGSILCGLLASDAFVENFMNQYATTENAITISVEDLKKLSKKCADLHNRRKQNLYEESFKINAFLEYVQTDQARVLVEQHIKNVGAFCSKGHTKLAETSEGVQALQADMQQTFERLKTEALFQQKVLAVTENQYIKAVNNNTVLNLEEAKVFIKAAFMKPKHARQALLKLVLQPGRVQETGITAVDLMKALNTEITRARRKNWMWGLKLAASTVKDIYAQVKYPACFWMVAYSFLSFVGLPTIAFLGACWFGFVLLFTTVVAIRADLATYKASLEKDWAVEVPVPNEALVLTDPSAVLSRDPHEVTHAANQASVGLGTTVRIVPF